MAPRQCKVPRASAGLSIFDASMAPSAAPAPTKVWSSSMNNIISPFDSSISLSTLFNLSSNSPLNFAPAISNPRSRLRSRLFRNPLGTSAFTILVASPSTIAVLPTPGSPIKTGLFFVRRQMTCIVLLISSSRPITGSSLPLIAASVTSCVYLISALCSSSNELLSNDAVCLLSSMLFFSLVFETPFLLRIVEEIRSSVIAIERSRSSGVIGSFPDRVEFFSASEIRA